MLINYIAAEPTVAGARGYSELERGDDGLPGLRWHVRDVEITKVRMGSRFSNSLGRGFLRRVPMGRRCMSPCVLRYCKSQIPPPGRSATHSSSPT